MASGLLLLEGFEAMGTTADRYSYQNVSRNVSASYGRFGGKGINCGYSSHVKFALGATYSHLIVGCALKDVDGPDELQISFYDTDGNNHQCTVFIYPVSGAIRVYRGNGSTLLGSTASLLWKDNVWNYLEVRMKHDNSAGEVELKLNGIQVLNLTSLDTTNTANAYATEVWIGNCNNIDDVYIVDKTVSGATFLGDLKIVGLLPNADDTVAWSRSTGSTNYSCVDETDSNQDTDYVYTTATSTSDIYGLPDLSGTPTIKGVEIVTTAKRDNTASAEIRNLAKSGTNTTSGTTTALSIDYTLVRTQLENVPGGTGWSYSDVNGLKVGVERVT